jgi:hypothetical protein
MYVVEYQRTIYLYRSSDDGEKMQVENQTIPFYERIKHKKIYVNSITREYVITTVSLRSVELVGISLVFEESHVKKNGIKFVTVKARRFHAVSRQEACLKVPLISVHIYMLEKNKHK